MTTMTEQMTNTLEAPGAVLTYDVRGADSDAITPVLLMIGSPMGAGVRHARRALPGPHDRDLRPPRRGAQRQGRSDQRVDAPAACRRPAQDHRRARLGPGRHLREQRWRRERARPRGGAPGGRADARRPRPRAAPSSRPRGALAACEAVRDAYQQHGFGVGMAVHPRRRTPGPMTLEFANQPDPIRRCSACPPWTTATGPTPCCTRTSSRARTTSPTSSAARGVDPDRRRRGRESAGRWRTVRPRGGGAAGLEPVLFPSDHGGFLGGEYGQKGDPDGFAAKLREVLADA